MPTKGVTDSTSRSLDDRFLTKTVQYRGTVYRLREVSIAKFDDIQKAATRQEEQPDGTMVERFDPALRDRLLLAASVVEPANFNVSRLGTREVGGLTRLVNELHYADEPDELKGKGDGGDAEEGEKAESSGNA